MSKKIKHLVVDTNAFLKGVNLQDIAENVYTIQEVVNEVTDDRQRRRLCVLPYDLKIKDVFTENIRFISDFSKKTGDYKSLSATDIKVMALTYQLEKEIVGSEHLKMEVTMQRNVNFYGIHSNTDTNKATQQQNPTNPTTDSEVENSENEDITNTDETPHLDENNANDEEIAEQVGNMNFSDEKDTNEDIVETSDDSDGEWITPSNFKQKQKELEHGVFEDKNVDVACMTSDFAMQNVMKHIGLNITSSDGRMIKQIRTYILRCTTCYATTSIMDKLFCGKCGYKALRKVSVTIDDSGNQQLHINARKPLSSKRKRFSLPTPRGGQHFQYPILTEDQHIKKSFVTKLARKKTNALDPDYTAESSPFVMRDVNSRSAVLGLRASKQDVKYMMKHARGNKKW